MSSLAVPVDSTNQHAQLEYFCAKISSGIRSKVGEERPGKAQLESTTRSSWLTESRCFEVEAVQFGDKLDTPKFIFYNLQSRKSAIV